MKLKRIAGSLFVGVAFAALQNLLVFADFSAPNQLRNAAILFAMPGMITAMAVGRNVHAFSSAIVAVANSIFYAILTYGLISLWSKRRRVVHARNRT